MFFTLPDALKSAYDVVIIGAGGHGLASGVLPGARSTASATLP